MQSSLGASAANESHASTASPQNYRCSSVQSEFSSRIGRGGRFHQRLLRGLLDAVASGIPTLCFADDLDHYRPYLTDGFIDEVPCLVTERGTGAFIDGIKKAVGSCDESVKAFRNRWVGASDGKAGTRVADLLERL